MDRDRSLSKLELGIPGWMVGKTSILRRTNSLLACHCLFVSQGPLKDCSQFSRCGFWLRNSETISPPLSSAITGNMQNNTKLAWEVQKKESTPHSKVQGLRAVILGMFPSDTQTNTSTAAGKILMLQTQQFTHKHKYMCFNFTLELSVLSSLYFLAWFHSSSDTLLLLWSYHVIITK